MLFRAAKFYFKKSKQLCPSLTRMPEHMLEDCCCKYCDQNFTRRTEKLSHKKYMCKQYKITFSHSVELHINTHTKYVIWKMQQRVKTRHHFPYHHFTITSPSLYHHFLCLFVYLRFVAKLVILSTEFTKTTLNQWTVGQARPQSVNKQTNKGSDGKVMVK